MTPLLSKITPSYTPFPHKPLRFLSPLSFFSPLFPYWNDNPLPLSSPSHFLTFTKTKRRAEEGNESGKCAGGWRHGPGQKRTRLNDTARSHSEWERTRPANQCLVDGASAVVALENRATSTVRKADDRTGKKTYQMAAGERVEQFASAPKTCRRAQRFPARWNREGAGPRPCHLGRRDGSPARHS